MASNPILAQHIRKGEIVLNDNRTLTACTEAILIDRTKLGDAAAFQELMDANRQRALNYARRLSPSIHDAEDIVQEAFIRAFRGIKKFRSGSCFITWLLRIVTRVCSNSFRKRSRRCESEFKAECPETRSNPQIEMELFDQRKALVAAVNQLSEKLRFVFVRYEFEHCTYDEIAQIANIPLGTVKSRLFLAREEIRKNLVASGWE